MRNSAAVRIVDGLTRPQNDLDPSVDLVGLLSACMPRRRTSYRLTDDQSALAGRNVGLVRHMAVRWASEPVFRGDLEELISIGTQALCRAASKFDLARGYQFSTYACNAIGRAFIREKQIRLKPKRDVRRESGPIDERLTGGKTLGRKVGGSAEASEQQAICREVLDLLEPNERRVIEGRFFHGLRLQELGDQLGVSRQRIQQIEATTLSKLRGMMKHRGLLSAA